MKHGAAAAINADDQRKLTEGQAFNAFAAEVVKSDHFTRRDAFGRQRARAADGVGA